MPGIYILASPGAGAILIAGRMSGEEFAEWLECIAPNGEAVLALKSAVDESGSHDDAALLCVAFCITTSTQWRKFEREWADIRILPPGVRHYHAKDRRCDRLSDQLAGLMQRRMERIVAITIHEREYKALDSPRFRSFAGDAYALAIQAGLYHIHRWLWKAANQRIAYVLESGHKGQPAADKFLTLVGDTPFLRAKLRFLSHTWLPKGELVLDPPDLMSHEISTAGGRDTSPRVRRMGGIVVIHHLSIEELREAQQVVEAGFRERSGRRQKRKLRRYRDV